MDLIVTVSEIARRLRLPQPLEEDDRWEIEQAITDAQADLEAYLGQSLTPRTYTETGLIPYPSGYNLIHAPLVEIVSETAEQDVDGNLTGRYTVVYRAGLDGAADVDLEPLRRYVRTHALYSPQLQARLRALHPDTVRAPTSVAVEGQSVSWTPLYDTDAADPGSGAPGALPTLASCDRWRRRSVYQRPVTPGRERWC